MASNGDDNRLISEEVDCSETTVEIKIKTLDSQTYTLRVDKCVPIPALKEQIALVTGVLSEQQRLICRGRVLKDDQLLSEYHVEDGHTLHLVVRQPVVPSSEGSPSPATDPASTSGQSQGPGVIAGSLNISEEDGSFSDISRVFSALLGSLGLAGIGINEGVDLNEHPLEGILNAPGVAGLRNSSRSQPDLTDSRGQSITDSGGFTFPTANPVEAFQPPVIPDSLATLSQNLNRLRQEFIANVQELTNSSQAVGVRGQNSDAASVPTVQRGLPTPALLADMMLTTRQILNEQVEECLLLLARQLEGHADVTDASERVRIQSAALRSGVLFQNFGAVLLELARTTMTLRMGQTPAEAIVNTGPAVFLSQTGPNPIMVQPLSFQLGTGVGATGGTVQQSSGLPAASGGSGVFPRNIDIRIRTVAVPASANRREPTGSQNLGQTSPAASNAGNSAQEGSGSPATREPGVHAIPVSTVVTASPTSGGQATPGPSRGTMGMILPVFARVQRVTSGVSSSVRAPPASDQHHVHATDHGSQSIPNSALQHQNFHVVGVDSGSNSLGDVTDGQGHPSQSASQLEQFLRGVFAGDHINDDASNPPQGIEADAITGHVAQNSDNPEAAATATTDEGTFLSNILRQIMPIISQNGGSGSNNASSDGDTVEDRSRQGSSTFEESGSRAPSSRHQDDPLEQPGPKRQKRD